MSPSYWCDIRCACSWAMKSMITTTMIMSEVPFGWLIRLCHAIGSNAMVLILFFKAFVGQQFTIPSASMRNTLMIGDHLLVNKLVYKVRDIERGIRNARELVRRLDVQTAVHTQVLNREAIDAIPTGRTIQGMGQLIVGVSLNLPDTGGADRFAVDEREGRVGLDGNENAFLGHAHPLVIDAER